MGEERGEFEAGDGPAALLGEVEKAAVAAADFEQAAGGRQMAGEEAEGLGLGAVLRVAGGAGVGVDSLVFFLIESAGGVVVDKKAAGAAVEAEFSVVALGIAEMEFGAATEAAGHAGGRGDVAGLRFHRQPWCEKGGGKTRRIVI